jgi:dTDP-D-glucose 4,6-dehydratase
MRYAIDATRLNRELGWALLQFEEGLEKTVDGTSKMNYGPGRSLPVSTSTITKNNTTNNAVHRCFPAGRDHL